MLINDTLTWSDHVDMHMICRKVSCHLNLLRRLSWFLPRSLLLTYLKSYILPHFDYCDVVWSGCTQGESRRLESLLNFGCKIVLHRHRDSSSTAALQELGLTTLTLRRKLHMAQCIFAAYPPRLHLICLGSSLMFLATITLVPLSLPNLIFPWSGLHSDRRHLVLPVLPSFAA